MRQNDRAADHLVGVARIDAKAQRNVDGLVELRVLGLLKEGNCVCQGVGAGLDERARLGQILRDLLRHLYPCLPPLNLAALIHAELTRNCFSSTSGWMSRSAVVL
jgi:hypothetical protein